MDTPVIITRTGSQIPLASADGAVLTGITRGTQRISLLTEEIVDLEVETTHPLPIGPGDMLRLFNRLYTLNQKPEMTKTGHNRLKYALRFEGPQYDLIRCTCFDLDAAGVVLSSAFTLTGNLQTFATLLMRNLQRVMGGKWTLGQVNVPGENTLTGQVGQVVDGEFTEVKTLSIENENCLSVLQKLCSEWHTEFVIEPSAADLTGRSWLLHIRRAGSALDDIFRYGDGNAVYKLTRTAGESREFATRLYLFGATKNVPLLYRTTKEALALTNPQAQVGTRLRLPLPAQNPSDSELGSYLEDADAIAQYGLIEGVKIFEEIFPGFTRSVGLAVDQTVFQDTGIGFNPMEIESWYYGADGYPVIKHRYYEKGQQPKVSFLTGDLAGYSFVISQFTTNNNLIYLLPYTDERGMVFPSPDPTSPFRIKTGDEYTLLDIAQPEEYILAAEQKLLAAGTTYFAENSRPPLAYRVDLDELYYQEQAGDTGPRALPTPPVQFRVGDLVRLIDASLGVSEEVRILSLSRDVGRPYNYTLELGLKPPISNLRRILARQTTISQILKRNAIELPAPGQGAGAGFQLTPETQADIDQRVRNALSAQLPTRHTLSAIMKLPDGFTGIPDPPAVRHTLSVTVKNNGAYLGTATLTARKRAFPSSPR